jgi:MFS family permease
MEESGEIISYPDIIYILFAAIVGFIIDKRGKRGVILALGFAVSALSQFIFSFLKACPPKEQCTTGMLPMIMVGFANTLIHLSLYPTVNYIVKEKYFGTAYGLVESATNVGYLFGSLALGDILNKDLGKEAEATDLEQFDMMHQVLFYLSLLGLCVALFMNYYDFKLRPTQVLNQVG